jgi:hypothetical protein
MSTGLKSIFMAKRFVVKRLYFDQNIPFYTTLSNIIWISIFLE